MTTYNAQQPKKLYKSEKDKMVSGLLAGIAEYFNLDSTIVRVAFILVLLITGVFPGIVAYVVAFFIIPDAPRNDASAVPPTRPEVHTPPSTGAEMPVEPETAPQPEPEIKTEPVEKETAAPTAADTMERRGAHLSDVM